MSVETSSRLLLLGPAIMSFMMAGPPIFGQDAGSVWRRAQDKHAQSVFLSPHWFRSHTKEFDKKGKLVSQETMEAALIYVDGEKKMELRSAQKNGQDVTQEKRKELSKDNKSGKAGDEGAMDPFDTNHWVVNLGAARQAREDGRLTWVFPVSSKKKGISAMKGELWIQDEGALPLKAILSPLSAIPGVGSAAISLFYVPLGEGGFVLDRMEFLLITKILGQEKNISNQSYFWGYAPKQTEVPYHNRD